MPLNFWIVFLGKSKFNVTYDVWRKLEVNNCPNDQLDITFKVLQNPKKRAVLVKRLILAFLYKKAL